MKAPEDIFEVHGYFEEIGMMVGDTCRSLGTREVEKPGADRPLGAYGHREYKFTSNITLTKGHKVVLIKASDKKPLVCFGIAHALCGRIKSDGVAHPMAG